MSDKSRATELAAAIGSPALPGAACLDRWEAFDAVLDVIFDHAVKPDAQRDALAVCESCRAMLTCRSWAVNQPWPAGFVVGGQIIAGKPKEPATKPPEWRPAQRRRKNWAALVRLAERKDSTA
jgi:hypothetical protein